MDLKNTVFFLTGGANGLGKACVSALLENGAKVYFGDIDRAHGEDHLKKLQAKFGVKNVAFQLFDVSDFKAYEAAVKAAISKFGQVDVFVNNAGVMHEGEWQNMLQTNLVGTINGTKIATEYFRKDKGGRGGRIVNISSISGLYSNVMTPIYAATKHGVRAYTTSLAEQPDIEKQGVEYGLLCPDAMDTDMIKNLDKTRIFHFEVLKPYLDKKLLQLETVVDAFLHLVQLKNMNNAMLYVDVDGKRFMKIEPSDAPNPV